MGIERTVLIRQSDLSGLKPSFGNKIKDKLQKTEIPTFSLYFGGNSFVKCFVHSETLKQLSSSNFWFHLAPIGQCKVSSSVP